MRLGEMLDRCGAATVTVAPHVPLAEAAQAMARAGATAVIVAGGRFDGILTAADLLRHLALAPSPAEAWSDPVAAALGREVAIGAGDDPVGRAIETMTAGGIDHLAVATDQGIAVVSLCRLVRAENALLHDELHHLQNYIDALHDAPND